MMTAMIVGIALAASATAYNAIMALAELLWGPSSTVWERRRWTR